MPNITSAKQRDWAKAAKKLGLEVNTRGGKGSHIMIVNGGQKYTIQTKLFPVANIKIMKKFVEWGFSEDEILRALN